ncbi:MAG: acetyl-CoA carboxylase biotin carboxyl carrier protein [Planctomycetota bacterium]|nr:acetyl-CoA carboxylase biotin carboxyl carrier protein [Planctomycetota bacterium]
MDQRELKKLVQLMNDNGLIELEIEREGERLHLRKAEPPGSTPPLVHMTGMPVGAAPMMAMPGAGAPAPAAETPAEEAKPDPNLKEIRSPMVGTFYRRPSPDADAYVDVGDSVEEETIVCIVEAMKVNNEIKAELDGEVVEVLVDDGHPVEFDQPLFRVRV